MVFTILLTVLALVKCEDFAKSVQQEESDRYNEYLKAITSGNLFPSTTQEEITEAEELMAEVYPIGDPELPLPDTEEDLEKEICSVYADANKKIMSYVRKRYPMHLMVQIAVRLNLYSLTKKNEDYCKSVGSRKNYIKFAPIINKSMDKLKLARNQIISSFRAVIYGETTATKPLGVICCSYWVFKKDSLNAIQTKEGKKFLKDMIDAYNGKSLNYLCINYPEDSKNCKQLTIPSSPQNVDSTRFLSIYSSAIEALSKVNSYER